MLQTLITPRQCVGAVAAVVDDLGQVLIVEHVFRTDFPWGLPGGWVKPGEDPATGLVRECLEELQLDIEVRSLLAAETIPSLPTSGHPRHLGLAFYCRARGTPAINSHELLSMKWVTPATVDVPMADFQRRALESGHRAFQVEHHEP